MNIPVRWVIYAVQFVFFFTATLMILREWLRRNRNGRYRYFVSVNIVSLLPMLGVGLLWSVFQLVRAAYYGGSPPASDVFALIAGTVLMVPPINVIAYIAWHMRNRSE